MREVSRRVLRYQSSRESLSPGDHLLLNPQRGLGGAVTSPLHRDREAPPPPRTILSPRLLPKATTPNGPNRRHSLAVPLAVSPRNGNGDRTEELPVPTVSPRSPRPPPLRVPSRGPRGQPSPLDVPPAFRFGDLFQKRSNQDSARARPDRQGGSAFVSFFKRLGEKHARPPPTEHLES
ncbi:hypothetical protein SKAU_G00324460 [Synaphobranchus kaupii]|uniref:Uncharacterized protein n=1 Tax=Synaphobranchus kaupii TaxID=118154 RepID=A0A9Q1EPC0_SYNKA|nr:hypothetical protein SKAU_G00324460 [Synaphobranchus kaupii]